VYGLLDHAWDMYTAFCSAYGDDGKGVAELVTEACAAAADAHLPSWQRMEEMKRQLADAAQEMVAAEVGRGMLQGSLADMSTQLKQWKAAADELNMKLPDAEAEKKKEAGMLDELWEICSSHCGYSKTSGYTPKQKKLAMQQSMYSRNISASLKARLALE
jgi:peptidoglycan hydrolase CwlO-like protein